MEQKFKIGDRVSMFDYYTGVVREYNPYQPPFYTVYCEHCKMEHIVFERDLELVEEKVEENEPARD